MDFHLISLIVFLCPVVVILESPARKLSVGTGLNTGACVNA